MNNIQTSIMQSIIAYRYNNNITDCFSVGVMVSGGVDSSVLLHAIHSIHEVVNVKPIMLYVDFTDFASHKNTNDLIYDYAKKYKLELIKIPSNIENMTIGIKECARIEMKSLAFLCDANLIFTGHHHDDQIETILFRLFRGSGQNGLIGMQEFSDYIFNHDKKTFCKPFVPFSKDMLIEYANENNVAYVNDETNENNEIHDKDIPNIHTCFIHIIIFELMIQVWW